MKTVVLYVADDDAPEQSSTHIDNGSLTIKFEGLVMVVTRRRKDAPLDVDDDHHRQHESLERALNDAVSEGIAAQVALRQQRDAALDRLNAIAQPIERSGE